MHKEMGHLMVYGNAIKMIIILLLLSAIVGIPVRTLFKDLLVINMTSWAHKQFWVFRFLTKNLSRDNILLEDKVGFKMARLFIEMEGAGNMARSRFSIVNGSLKL